MSKIKIIKTCCFVLLILSAAQTICFSGYFYNSKKEANNKDENNNKIEMTPEEQKAAMLAEELAVERKLKLQEQELIARTHCRNGIDAYKAGKLKESLNELNLALELDPENKTAEKYLKYAQAGLDQIIKENNRKLYDEALVLGAAGSYEQALLKLEQIISDKSGYYKKEAEEYYQALEQKQTLKEQKQGIGAKAKIRRKKEKNKETAFLKAKKYYRAGEFDQAVAEWKKVFKLADPEDVDYKRATLLIQKARKKQLKIEKKKLEKEMLVSEKTMRSEVKTRWIVSKEEEGKKSKVKETADLEPLESRRRIIELSKQTISIDFDKKHIREVLAFLDSITGVNLVLDDSIFPKTAEQTASSGEGFSPNVTIHLKDIPLIEALDVILRTKSLKYRIEENLIWITTPEILAQETFITEVFQLSSGTGSMRDIIEEVVPWPEGSSINLDSRAGTLIVTNTPTNVELIKDIVLALDITPIQVAIQAKFIEIDNTLLEEYCLVMGADDVALTDKEIGRGYFSAITTSWYEVTDGEGFSLDYRNLRDDGTYAFGLAMEALAATGKVKVLSAPKVTTVNNQEATIEIVSGIPFIDSYSIETEDIEVQNQDLKQSVMVPGDAVTKKTGILLTVIPSVGADRKTINLTLVPEVTELADWLTYPVANGSIRVPVFDTRRVNTSVIVADGGTVVLGGLAKEAERKFKNTIPLIGNIPVINKLFGRDSKTDEVNSLLIFVTAQILTPTGETYQQ